MLNRIEIENIEEMRRQQGIEDVELAETIRSLQVGDVVKLTFLSQAHNFETARVRITSIRGIAFRGRVIQTTSRARQGKIVEFTIAHIHSVVAPRASIRLRSSLR